MKWNERIRALREDKDLLQINIAEQIHVTQRMYSYYEAGHVRIPVEHLITLAKFYDVSMDYICGVSDIKNPFPKQ